MKKSLYLATQWHFDDDMHSGAYSWGSSQHPFIIYATPFWETDKQVIPISVMTQDGDTILFTEIPCPELNRDYWCGPDASGDSRHESEHYKYFTIMEANIPLILYKAMKEINPMPEPKITTKDDYLIICQDTHTPIKKYTATSSNDAWKQFEQDDTIPIGMQTGHCLHDVVTKKQLEDWLKHL